MPRGRAPYSSSKRSQHTKKIRKNTEAVKLFNSNTKQSNIYDKNELQAVCAVRQTVGSKDKDETLLERKL